MPCHALPRIHPLFPVAQPCAPATEPNSYSSDRYHRDDRSTLSPRQSTAAGASSASQPANEQMLVQNGRACIARLFGSTQPAPVVHAGMLGSSLRPRRDRFYDLARPALRSPPGRASVELAGKGETWTMVWARGVVYTALAPGPEVEPFGEPNGRTASVLSPRSWHALMDVTI